MSKNFIIYSFVIIITVGIVKKESIFAQVRLPSVISDHMVLQQKSNIKLWGWASPAEKIYLTPSWSNVTDSVIADNNARWQINVNTPPAGGPYSIIIKAINTIILNDVMIGEVWLCSGQSNMDWSYNYGIKEIAQEFGTCKNNSIRFYTVSKTTSPYPQDNCHGEWVICDSNTLKSFSAVGYYFGREINKELKVPVGLINASWPGTAAEVWTPADTILNDMVLKKASEKLIEYQRWPVKAGYAYNAMIAPLSSFSIAGVIWYQGESNVMQAASYTRLFNAMISSWRKAWNKNFPFYYVQIAPYKYKYKNTAALLREAQSKSALMPGVGMVVITDLVDNLKDIHPQNKKDVGIRLAKWALSENYKLNGLTYKSPVFKDFVIIENKMIITFNFIGKGIECRGNKVNELYISGKNGVFYPADSKIENNKLVVWNDNVKNPVAVRYAFGNTACGNLFNVEGLPVAPFRTDNWEVDTKIDN